MEDSPNTTSRVTANSGPLVDGYQRRIDYLRVSVTDRCNLRCVYCSPAEPGQTLEPERLLGSADILRLVGLLAARGLRKVRITGGEPLLREDLLEIISGLRQLEIPDISLTTNGTLLAGWAGHLRRAGLRRVNISLDTLNPERYRGITRGGDIAQVWRAIEAAQANELAPVKLNVVPVHGLNDDEIVDFARLTLEHDFHVRFIELMPAAGCQLAGAEGYVRSGTVLARLAELGPLEKLPFRGRGPSRNYRLPGARGVIGIISPYNGHFCRHCNRLRLSADGRIRPCLFSKKTIDLGTALRAGASDEELQQLLSFAAACKPRGNELGKRAGSCVIPAMSQIGG